MRIYPKSHEGVAIPEFGIDANVLQTKQFDLGAARALQRYEIGGTLLWVAAASSRGAYVDVYFNDQLRDPIRFGLGMFIRGVPFSRIFVSHPAQAGESITVLYAAETVDNIHIENPALQYTEVEIAAASLAALESVDLNAATINTLSKPGIMNSQVDLVIVAGAAAVMILAIHGTRRAAIIGSLTANTQVIRVADANCGANRGQEINPGEEITLYTSAAIYGYTAAGVNQTVSRLWTTD